MEKIVTFTDEALIKQIEALKKGDETFAETVQRLCETALNGLQWGNFGKD